jgi:FKBP-type peptidyl-prolyl cis-trans isomerase
MKNGCILFLLCALLSSGCTNRVLLNLKRKMTSDKTDAQMPEEFSTTSSGLKYRLLRDTGGDQPKATDQVTVHYKGWLDDGTVFDSSYDRGEPITFPLNRVIPGWTEGMQLVGEGGKIELEIPSELGYGSRGAPGAIPPNARLHFEVELIKIK